MSSRRKFLSAATTSAATLAIGCRAGAEEQPQATASPVLPVPVAGSPWDMGWIETLGGQHRQVFDLGAMELQVVSNYLRAFREVYGLQHPDVVAVVGIAFKSFPINASDALWERFELGRLWDVRDPMNGKPARRNIFAAELPAEAPAMLREAMIPNLREQGVHFWQCANALKGVAMRLAGETDASPDDVERELKEGLMPGVRVVPAHTMLLGLLQERGFTYEHVM